MPSSILRTLLGALILVLPATASLAHTAVATISPKSGSVLAQSPPVIEITFQHEARLTSVIVVQAGKPERKLEFLPKGSATVFKVSNPNLPIGRNDIQWKALSKDGHAVNGSLVLTIEPAASKAN